MGGLTRDDIDHIMGLVDQSNFDELKLEMGDIKLELRRRGAVQSTTMTEASPSVEHPVQVAPKEIAPTAPGTGIEVPAPLLGTFYHAAKPGDAAFVTVGDTVAVDTVIGIIEVMKLMNQVTAGVSGIVTEITAPNGELVEYGQTLIRVQQA